MSDNLEVIRGDAPSPIQWHEKLVCHRCHKKAIVGNMYPITKDGVVSYWRWLCAHCISEGWRVMPDDEFNNVLGKTEVISGDALAMRGTTIEAVRAENDTLTRLLSEAETRVMELIAEREAQERQSESDGMLIDDQGTHMERLEAERDDLRDAVGEAARLLRIAQQDGIDDYWITLPEGVEWRAGIDALLAKWGADGAGEVGR